MIFSGMPAPFRSRIGVAFAVAVSLWAAACAGDFIPDYPDYTSLPDVTIPDVAGLDLPDVAADDGEACSRNCYDRVCGPDDCGGTCGTCPSGTVCSLDYSICLVEAVLLPDGSHCGRTSQCTPELEDPYTPGEYYTNPDWPRCRNHQCAGLLCDRGVCTRPCVVRNDKVINGTGISGSDGIEDNTSDSDCVTAQGTLFTGSMMCVARRMNSDGVLEGVCVPASSFTPCNPGDNCPGDEECSYLRTINGMERRCSAPLESDAVYTDECGWNAVVGADIACRSGLCSDTGCTRPCDLDDDCLTAGAFCDGGFCAGTGFPCSADTDCSSWYCGASVVLESIPTTACAPKTCSGDMGCPGDGYYCVPVVGTDDLGQVVSTGRCARTFGGGAEVGSACGPDDGGPVTLCHNRDLCIDGLCSATCENDFDCFVYGDFRCALTSVRYDVGYIAVDYWVDVGFCQPTGYRREGCASDDECGDRVCTPFVSDARGEREVVKTCMDSPADGWPLGTSCGQLAWDAVCRSRYCFGEDVDNGIPGWCSRTCVSDSDCPESASWMSKSWRWVCAGMPVIGGESPSADDDLFASWCVPVPLASSIEDCGSTRMCTDITEVCSPILRAGPGVHPERVDYRCTTAGEGGMPGTICDPFGDGSDCATGICSPSAMSDIGFCSLVCLTDFDCAVFGETVTCQAAQVGRSTEDEALTADVCRMTGECIVCVDDTDCAAGTRCVNITGNYWYEDMRCVRECESDADCADITGMACEDVFPVYSASSLQFKACMTPSCS